VVRLRDSGLFGSCLILFPVTRQDFASEYYGALPLNQSQSRPRHSHTLIGSLSSSADGQRIVIRARVQTSRAQGNKMVFLNLRQRTDSVQALLTVEPEKVSKQMVKWAAGLADESIVRVEGLVRKTPEPIKSATVQDVELHVFKVCLHILLLRRPDDNDVEMISCI
jgi:aspartyl-tRNA synthetase